MNFEAFWLQKIDIHTVFEPYTYNGIAAWGQAAQVYLRKVLILQKRALWLMFFAGNRSHAIPLFVSANVLPLNMLSYARHIFQLFCASE